MRTLGLLSVVGFALLLPKVGEAAAGDFNNDGFDDLAIGVPAEDLGVLVGTGAVNVLMGSATGLTDVGDQLWTQDSVGVLDTAETGDQFGDALGVGDFNADGFDDLAIGARFENIGAVTLAGAVTILPGSAAGLTDLGNQFWNQDSAGILDTAETDDAFGSALAVGDFNADGFDDLAIGAHYDSVGALLTAGVVNVLLGSAAGLTSAGNQLWHQNTAGVLGAAQADDELGRALTAGDFDDDGFDDLAIGVPREDRNGIGNAGTVNVLFGSAAGLATAGNQRWDQNSAGILDLAEADDQFGTALVAADFNSDGFADLGIGVVGEDLGALASAGAAHLFLGSATGLTSVGDQFWNQDSAGVLDVAEGGDQFGDALAAGDFNNDGFPDLAVGDFGEDIGAAIFSAGAVNVLPGSAAGLTAAGDQFWHQDSTGILDTAEIGDNFGSF